MLKQGSFENSEHLRVLCARIEQEVGWGSSDLWKNGDFMELSNKVKRVSGVRISADTLKRVFGKLSTDKTYDPQIATKDALSIFLGYSGWYEFVDMMELKKTESFFIDTKLPPRNLRIGIVVLLVLLFFGGAWLVLINRSVSYDFSINGKYLEGDAFHTVVFDYDLSNVSTDEVYLDFGDNSVVKLDREKKTVSHYFRGPGLYHIHLSIEDRVVYDTTAYLSTNGWEAYTFYPLSDPTMGNDYLPIYDLPDSSWLAVEHDFPIKMGVDTTALFWLQFSNFRDYGINGDNFEFSTDVKNDVEILRARCNHIKIRLVGKYGVIQLYFLREGCSSWVVLQFGEKTLRGDLLDLSVFGTDFLDFRTVRVYNEQQHVKVFLDSALIYEVEYNESIGPIMGLDYHFTGVGGEVKNTYLEPI